MKNCAECKIQFSSNEYTPGQKYCSEGCRNESSRRKRRKNKDFPITRDCKYCGDEFVTKTHNKIYCSEKCYDLHSRANIYGLSSIDHLNIMSQQTCQICNDELKDKEKCIDHCHITMKVRGMICRKCNVGLGNFKDSPDILKKAIAYLGSAPIETKIVEIMKDAYSRNWISSRDGNISIIHDGIFYITPSGVRKHEMIPSDILKLKIIDGIPEKENHRVSGEFEMHLELQKISPGCVIHLHPTAVIAAMEKGWNLPDISDKLQELSRSTKVAHNVRKLPVTSSILALETFQSMVESSTLVFDIVGQAGHGVTSVGKTLEEAYEHIERLNHACEIILLSGVSPK